MSRTVGSRKPAGNSKAAAAERERLFVEAYVTNGGNKTKAAVTAGYSERSAAQMATKIVARPAVANAIRRRQVELAERYELTTESVIAELSKIVHADPRKLFNVDGSLKNPSEWPESMAGVVASFEVVEEFAGRGNSREMVGYTKKIKLWDKNSAIEKAMKHLGLFAEDNKQRAGALEGLPRELLKAIAERLRAMGHGKAGSAPRLDR